MKQNKTQLREFTNNVHFLPIILVQNPENLTEVQLESVQKQIGAFVSSVKSNKKLSDTEDHGLIKLTVDDV